MVNKDVKINDKQRYQLKRFIKQLDGIRGRGTELVSVYVPSGYNLDNISQHIQEEQGTATNIKSKQTRDNVIAALEKIIQHLKRFKRTPPNGLVVFAGNVSDKQGQDDHQVYSLEPPVPLNQRLYRCDKEFVLEPLKEMADDKDTYGMIVMDRREGNIALLKGKTIIPLISKESRVPGKFKTGGQCLAKDSVVQQTNGTFRAISNVNVGNELVGVHDNSLENVFVKDSWDSGSKKTLKLITKHPQMRIECSPDHVFPVKTRSGVVDMKAEDLSKEDILLTVSKLYAKGEVQTLDSKKYHNSFVLNKKGQALIKTYRKNTDTTQKQLAKKIKTTQTTVSSYELGKLNIARGKMKAVARAISIPSKQFYSYAKPYQVKNIQLPETVDEDFAYFLGYYTGDGSSEIDRISLYEGDAGFANQLCRIFEGLFKTGISSKRRENKNYVRLRISSRPLTRLIRHEFPELRKSRNSRIPDKIARSPLKVVNAYLQGFFDAEGYARPKRGVGVGINNKRMLREIQMLLLRNGIISSFYSYDNSKNPYSDNVSYSLSISEKRSLQLFKENIGFKNEKKLRKLQESIANKTGKSNVRQVLVNGTKVRSVLAKHGYLPKDFPKISNFFRNERSMSEQVFEKNILSKIDKKCREELRNCISPVIPTKIKKIEVGRQQEMHDISVENQYFIANGLVTHNSAQRFARLREGAAKQFYKKIADMAKTQFYDRRDLKGILVGGPGGTKLDFVNGGYLPGPLKEKVIAIKDLSYTGDFGLEELLEKSHDVLAEQSVMEEKQIMQKFFKYLAEEPGMVTYGEDDTKRLLKLGAVDTVLISEKVSDEKVDEFVEEAEKVSSNIELISNETREGSQLEQMGGIVAILRYNAGDSFT